jgi:sigma-E factor negative regulatory protein RseC
MKEKEIEITRFNNFYTPGQQVTVALCESNGIKAVVFAYIVPFIIVMSALIISASFTDNELIIGIISLGSLVPYYLLLSIFREKFRKSFVFEIEE